MTRRSEAHVPRGLLNEKAEAKYTPLRVRGEGSEGRKSR